MILPMIFLCGTFFTVDKLPPVLREVIRILPLTHSSKLMRLSLLKGERSLLSFVVVTGYFLLFFFMAYGAIKRKDDVRKKNYIP